MDYYAFPMYNLTPTYCEIDMADLPNLWNLGGPDEDGQVVDETKHILYCLGDGTFGGVSVNGINGLQVATDLDDDQAGFDVGDIATEDMVRSNTATAISGVSASSDVITTGVSHGFVDGDLVQYVRFTGAGEVSNTLAGVSEAIGLRSKGWYYIINSTANTFKLSLTSGGGAVGLTAYSGADLSFHRIGKGFITTEPVATIALWSDVRSAEFVVIDRIEGNNINYVESFDSLTTTVEVGTPPDENETLVADYSSKY